MKLILWTSLLKQRQKIPLPLPQIMKAIIIAVVQGHHNPPLVELLVAKIVIHRPVASLLLQYATHATLLIRRWMVIE